MTVLVAHRSRRGGPQALREMSLRQDGCSVLAIERGGALLGVTAETHVEKGDQLYVCGSAEAVKMVAGLLAC